MSELRPTSIGRYVLHQQIARGGMATIHIARLVGDEGFSRIVAAKRLHPELAEDPDFVAMFLDEARIASKLHHRNVVPVLDVVVTNGEVMLVQELVHGVPLHRLLEAAWSRGQRVPLEIAISIACQVLAGLQAAHDMVDELGQPLQVVHRDISPQNVMVATDGTARLLDFGIAKASVAAHVTRPGTYKGKLAYSAPEQLRGKATQRSDVYSLAVVLWEMVVGHRMHADQSATEVIETVLTGHWPTICEALAVGADRGANEETWRQWKAVDDVVQRGLALAEQERWQTAAELEYALCDVVTPATTGAVATWLQTVGRKHLEKQERTIAAEEASWRRRLMPHADLDDDGIPFMEITLTTDAQAASEPDEHTRAESPRALTDDRMTSPRIDRAWTANVEEEQGWIAPGTERAASPRAAVSATSIASADEMALLARRPTTAPPARVSAWTVGVLGGVAGALVIAIVMVLSRSPAKPTTAARTAPATAQPAVAPLLVHAPAHATMTAPAVALPAVIAPHAPVTAPTEAAEPRHLATVPHEAAPAPAPAPSRASRRAAAKREAAAAKSAAKKHAAAKSAAKAADCEEAPYYFEGAKKIFKPECL